MSIIFLLPYLLLPFVFFNINGIGIILLLHVISSWLATAGVASGCAASCSVNAVVDPAPGTRWSHGEEMGPKWDQRWDGYPAW